MEPFCPSCNTPIQLIKNKRIFIYLIIFNIILIVLFINAKKLPFWQRTKDQSWNEKLNFEDLFN
ncbi:hypothetical protein Mgra_00002794 [Meloidogyne graminicola]|uniref:Uncharacterized protein n=1 Tax=Meloidogyne graminicola TaxID=189291 RepID=A0A8S9ZVZ5_9BILA|nr:hypothetical protein Mgra_00002794 [Meloidogyne graminicola]